MNEPRKYEIHGLHPVNGNWVFLGSTQFKMTKEEKDQMLLDLGTALRDTVHTTNTCVFRPKNFLSIMIG